MARAITLHVGLRVESGDGRVSFLFGADCTLVINSGPSITTSQINTIGFSTNSGKPIGTALPIGAMITIQGDNDKRGWIDFASPSLKTNELKI